jgi:hypothetical protein
METIILVSVLSTIGVVAVLLSVAVAFIKLRSKVDVNEMENQIRSIYEEIGIDKRENERQFNNIYNDMRFNSDNIHRLVDQVRADLYKHIDSRCDKLDAKIKPTEKNHK